MTSQPTWARRVAVVLVTHAAKALPSHRADWARAICAEIHHVSNDFKALGWALGCVFASYSERINAVNTRNPQMALIVLLSALGLIVVCASVLAAEFVSTRELTLLLPKKFGVTGNLYRVVVLSLTAVPIAYLTGYGLSRWVPALSIRVISVVALLFVLVIGLLQAYVYAPSVLGASILKVLFVVIPLALAGYRNRPIRVA